jgi:hypothetical protein
MKAAFVIATVALASFMGSNSAQAHHHHGRYAAHHHPHYTSLDVADPTLVIMHGHYIGRDPDLSIRLAMIRWGSFSDR